MFYFILSFSFFSVKHFVTLRKVLYKSWNTENIQFIPILPTLHSPLPTFWFIQIKQAKQFRKSCWTNPNFHFISWSFSSLSFPLFQLSIMFQLLLESSKETQQLSLSLLSQLQSTVLNTHKWPFLVLLLFRLPFFSLFLDVFAKTGYIWLNSKFWRRRGFASHHFKVGQTMQWILSKTRCCLLVKKKKEKRKSRFPITTVARSGRVCALCKWTWGTNYFKEHHVPAFI